MAGICFIYYLLGLVLTFAHRASCSSKFDDEIDCIQWGHMIFFYKLGPYIESKSKINIKEKR